MLSKLIVVGVEASVTKYVAQVQKVVAASGLKSHMHSYGTTIGTSFQCIGFHSVEIVANGRGTLG